MSPYKHRQQPTQQPVTLLGAASGNGSHRPLDSCENRESGRDKCIGSAAKKRDLMKAARPCLKTRCQAIRRNRARAIQHDAVLSRRPGFILSSC